jgi:tRNA threonylcarbamoyladenosine biosynthesis protein TsaE
VSERWTTRSEEETHRLGVELGQRLYPNGVLLLVGEMGTGKTVLTGGIAEALEVDPREVQSPTFSLIHEHRGRRGNLIHVDLYRLEPEQVLDLGLEELIAGPGVKVVEWAERLPFEVPEALLVRLRAVDEETREIELAPAP